MGNKSSHKYNTVKDSEDDQRDKLVAKPGETEEATKPDDDQNNDTGPQNNEQAGNANGTAVEGDKTEEMEKESGRKKFFRRFTGAFRSILKFHDDPACKEVAPGQIVSPYEMRLLKQTWAALEDDKDLFGQMIFLKVFETEPSLKVLFLWDDIPTELLCQNPAFQKHALNIVKIVESCVKRVDSLTTKISQPLQRLGKKHTRFQSFGFTPYHWELFQMSMITALTCEFSEDKRKDDIVVAWKKLTTFVVEEMRTGYHKCLQSIPDKGGKVPPPSYTPNPNQKSKFSTSRKSKGGVKRRRSNEDIALRTQANLTDYLKIAYPQYQQKRGSAPQ